MEERKRRLLSLLILTGLVLSIVWSVPRLGSRWGSNVAQANAFEASGVIMAEEITISARQGGKIAAVAVAEGDTVKAGQVLITMDTALLDAQIAVAEAQRAVADAALRQMEAGARPGTISVAEAQLQQAQVAHEVALQNWADAQTLRDNPQQIDMQIAVAEAQVEAEKHRLQSAVALKDAAETSKNLADYLQDTIRHWAYPIPPPVVPTELQSATYDWWKGWAGLNAASAKLQDAQAKLAYWQAVRSNPQQLNAQVKAAEAVVEQAVAGVDAALAQLNAYKAGASAEQLSAARARVAQAQAAVDALLAQREEMVLLAPVDGVLLSQSAYAGEIVAPGVTLLSLANLSEVKLMVYVAENRLGQIALSQQVAVHVDSFPERTFRGRIVRIADQAQYTPRNVATKEERVNTVYAVEIRVPNAEGLLKPGMAADVMFMDGDLPAGSERAGKSSSSGELESSGVIHVEEVRLAAEFQGDVAQVNVQAGDMISAGQALIVLNSNSIRSNVQQAEATLTAAQADLNIVRAGPRAEQIAAKRAQLAVAKAEEQAAYVAWLAADEALREPQELQEQILAAEAQVALAAQNVQLAEADYAQAQNEVDKAKWNTPERHMLELLAEAARANLAAARADEHTAQVALQHLRNMRDKPVALQAQARAAEGKYRVAMSAVQVRQAELDDLQAGATAEETAAAEANVALAQAQLRLAQMQMEHLTIRAPLNGTVLECMIHVGETVMPGVTLLRIADLSTVYLVVYVPENRLGEVHLGQKVSVTVDSFPQRPFEGQVMHIADQAQYTPRNVATKEERVNTVYAVKIRLSNAERLLKPGMAADAVFRP